MKAQTLTEGLNKHESNKKHKLPTTSTGFPQKHKF